MSAATPARLAIPDATVLFVYENTETGDRSLVVIHDAPQSETDGRAALTFEGVENARWQVRDDPPPAGPPTDVYETSEGPLGRAESVLWRWNANRTDGGAIGPLGDDFDVTITHAEAGLVRDSATDRRGLDRWYVVDGANPDSPIEVARFETDDETTGEAGDVSLRIRHRSESEP